VEHYAAKRGEVHRRRSLLTDTDVVSRKPSPVTPDVRFHEQVIKTMTPKENLMKILSGGIPNWMPACVHIANTNNLPGFLPETLLAQPLDRLGISEFVGGDILYEVHGIQTRLPDGVEIKTDVEGDFHCSTLITTEGCLTQQMVFSHTASPSYDDMPPDHVLPGPVITSGHTKYFVDGPEDYRALRAYYSAHTFETDQDLIANELKRVGDKGILVLGGGPASPLYSLVSSYAGIERLTYDLFDAPEKVESAMNAMKNAACQWYEVAAKTSCDVIRCTEDLDTKLISPQLFHQYAVPALREYARICHAHGKLFVIHMCGHIRDLLADVRDIGADAIHCLTMPPTGNTTLSEARSILAGHTAAMIRVDPDILLRGSAEQIDSAIAKICEGVGDWRNVLVIIPCGRASLFSIRRVIAQVHERGQWR